MDLGLAGKTAIVTGGGSGIGKAICFALAGEKVQVCVADIYQDRAETVANEIGKQGGKAIAVAADVSSGTDVDRMVDRVVKEWGRIDVLVNNAGIILQAPVLNMTEQQWGKILTNNLKSCFLCSRAVATHMVKQGTGGRIVSRHDLRIGEPRRVINGHMKIFVAGLAAPPPPIAMDAMANPDDAA